MKMHIKSVAIHLMKWPLPPGVTMVTGEWGGVGVGQGWGGWGLLADVRLLQTLPCCFITS